MVNLEGRLFITRAEFAELARCDVRTVSRGIESGTIPAVRMGRSIRIPVPKVLAMLGVSDDAPPGVTRQTITTARPADKGAKPDLGANQEGVSCKESAG